MQEYAGYLGLLSGASIAAVVTLLFWLLGLIVAWRSGQEERTSPGLELLPMLLLVPCAIHRIGMAALFKRNEPQQTQVQESLRQPGPLMLTDTAASLVPADSLLDAGE